MTGAGVARSEATSTRSPAPPQPCAPPRPQPPLVRSAESVEHAHRLRSRERQIERRHRPLRHRRLPEPGPVGRALRFEQQLGVNGSRQTAGDSTHQITATDPDTRRIAVTRVVVLHTGHDRRLVVAGVAGEDLADRQHDTTRARSPWCKCLNCSPPPTKDATTSEAADAGTGRRTCAGTPKKGSPRPPADTGPPGAEQRPRDTAAEQRQQRPAALRRLGRRADPDKRARSDSPYRCKGGRAPRNGTNQRRRVSTADRVRSARPS